MTSEKRQRKKEARQQKLEAERKAASRKELRRRIVTALGLGVVAVGIVLLFQLGSNDEVSSSYEGFRAQPTACGAEQPEPVEVMRFEQPADMGIEPDDTVTATIETSCGEIVIELDPARSPATVNSFVFLAEQGFYDGTVFHRIVENFVVQGGDPEATGRGGPGYRVPDEFPSDDFVYEPGVVAMANAGRGTTGSQFFIVTGDDAAFLGPTFNVLGQVLSGEQVLEEIESVPTRAQPGATEESFPEETVYVESVTIER